EGALGAVQIAVAHAAGDHAHQHFARPRRIELDLLHGDRRPRPAHHDSAHLHGKRLTSSAMGVTVHIFDAHGYSTREGVGDVPALLAAGARLRIETPDGDHEL